MSTAVKLVGGVDVTITGGAPIEVHTDEKERRDRWMDGCRGEEGKKEKKRKNEKGKKKSKKNVGGVRR